VQGLAGSAAALASRVNPAKTSNKLAEEILVNEKIFTQSEAGEAQVRHFMPR